MTEWTLSDKMFLGTNQEAENPTFLPVFDAQDVKEFIKRLREEIHNDPESCLESLGDFDRLLDKLAGEKLV